MRWVRRARAAGLNSEQIRLLVSVALDETPRCHRAGRCGMTATLRLSGLGHRYAGGRWVLQDCNVEVPAGRVVALSARTGPVKRLC